MNHLKLIHEYLKSKRSLDTMEPTGFPFITISREPGAGGHLLAHVIQSDMVLHCKDDERFEGWHVFDRELCEVVAQDPELQTSVEELLAEQYRSEYAGFLEDLFTGRSAQYRLFKKTFRIVRTLATLGRVIIVGRAGCCVTHDMPQGVHIRLVAPEIARVRWTMKKMKLDKEHAVALVRKQERERRRMVDDFFSCEISDPTLYDAVFNTAKADMHEISYAVIEMIKRRTDHKAGVRRVDICP